MKKLRNNLFKNLYFVLTCFCVVGCSTDCQNCFPDYFCNLLYSDTSEISKIFELGRPTIINSKCSYNHEFKFWQGIVVENKAVPYLNWKGRIYNLAGEIYFELDTGNTFKYFDFNMFVGQIETVNVVQYKDYKNEKIKLTKTYDLIMENKFFDENIKDTIFKFRFNKLGILFLGDDLVFYICRDKGLVGIYNSALIDSLNEEVFSSKGEIYFEKDTKYLKIFSRWAIH